MGDSRVNRNLEEPESLSGRWKALQRTFQAWPVSPASWQRRPLAGASGRVVRPLTAPGRRDEFES